MRTILFAAALLTLSTPALSDTVRTGTDTFASGATVSQSLNAPGDVFASGSDVSLRGAAGQDAHAFGFSVDVTADIGADLYAAGSSVTVRGDIGADATLAGFSVRMDPAADLAGNLRAAGNTVVVEAPIGGSATLAGWSITLDAPIAGDVRMVGQHLNFGDGAQIGGTLTYAAEEPVDIPAAVIPADRVTYEPISMGTFADRWGDAFPHERGSWFGGGTIFGGFILTIAFFVLLGALFLTFAPKRVEALQSSIRARPWMTALIGVIGLSMAFGALPIVGLTVIGLPLLPFLALGILILWVLGYALGAYAVARAAWSAFGGSDAPSLGQSLLVLAAGIAAIAILNFIPFVGWIANYTLVLLGVGAMTAALMNRILPDAGPALDVDYRPIDPSED